MPRLSPMEASTRYLKHLVSTWEHVEADKGPLSEQTVVLTVPASFDAVARDLTVQAAKAAGLDKPILLEEPQAALYAWLDHQGDGWRNHLERATSFSSATSAVARQTSLSSQSARRDNSSCAALRWATISSVATTWTLHWRIRFVSTFKE